MRIREQFFSKKKLYSLCIRVLRIAAIQLVSRRPIFLSVPMNKINKVAVYVAKNPKAAPAVVMLELAVALESGTEFSVTKLYELDRHEFVLAMGMIEDWRLDRYYMARLRLFDHAQAYDPQSNA